MGSFSEASKVLYTTQSAISKSVAALERQLGFELFLRGGRGISLTDSTLQVMRWVKNGAAELGFVFVFPDDNGQFDYDLRRYQLQFEALRTVSGMLYMSPEHMSGMQKSSRDSGKQTSEKRDSEKSCREDHHAAGDGDREEIAANPRHDKPCKERKEPGKRPACCREDCGKGHHGQRDVRNIEQKRADKTVLNRLSQEQKRKDAYRIDRQSHDHQCQIDPGGRNGCIHLFRSSFFMSGFSDVRMLSV